MKRLLIFIVLPLLMASCSLNNDDQPNFALEIMPIQSVDVPDQFTLGETYEIFVSYSRPNGCYEFNRFFYEPNENTRTIGVVDTVYLDEACTEAIEEATVSFDFLVTSTETYIFQFYQGTVEGEDQYLIVEVPVVE